MKKFKYQSKKICYFLVSLFIFCNNFLEAEDYAKASNATSPNTFYRHKLQNGLNIIFIPDKLNAVASLYFILDAGSNREHLGETGLAHFFEHMMFLKSEGRPEGHYDQVMYSVGGSANAETSGSYVAYYSTFPYVALENVLKEEAERFKHLDLSEPHFSKEKGAIISERKLALENDPYSSAQEFLTAYTQRGTSLAWDSIGTKADVEHMSLNAVKQFYKNYYTPDNTLLVLAGRFEPETVFQTIDRYFGNWQGQLKKQNDNFPADYLTRDLGKSLICSGDVLSKRYQIVYPSLDLNLKNLVYFYVFQAMINNNEGGSFYRTLIKNNLATDFRFYFDYTSNKAYPFIADFTLNEQQNADVVKKLWLENLKKLFKQPITEKIKNTLLKNLEMQNSRVTEFISSRVLNIVQNEYYFHDMYADQKSLDLVQHLDEQDFKLWLYKQFDEKNFYITGVFPTGDAVPCSEYKPQ